MHPLHKHQHCTAAENLKCTECSFWHAPTVSGDGCTTHSVRWVILLAVVVALIVAIAIVATTAVCIVVAVNAMTRRFQEQKQHETARVFKITHSNVVFIPTRLKDITISDQTCCCCGSHPVNTESKELVCVVNEGKKAV